jgi:hypothetical protein
MKNQYNRAQTEYIHGNTVRRIDPLPESIRRLAPIEEPASVSRKEKTHHMSFGYVLFLTAAMCAAAFILLSYVQMQGTLTQVTREVAAKEVQYNNMKVANDEKYNRIMSSIDLEDIKRYAMGELGMVYAQAGQVITYTNEHKDYMRQVSDADR